MSITILEKVDDIGQFVNTACRFSKRAAGGVDKEPYYSYNTVNRTT